jgi:hypothetical protein
LLDPVKSLRGRLEFILRLHDREALLPREGQRRFLEAKSPDVAERGGVGSLVHGGGRAAGGGQAG